VLSKVVGADAVADEAASRVSVPVRAGAGVLADVVRGLDDIGISIIDIALHRPSLDDVFLVLTGQDPAEKSQAGTAAAAKKDLVNT
jgi:ABC-2 type transport system ATP-binding protein